MSPRVTPRVSYDMCSLPAPEAALRAADAVFFPLVAAADPIMLRFNCRRITLALAGEVAGKNGQTEKTGSNGTERGQEQETHGKKDLYRTRIDPSALLCYPVRTHAFKNILPKRACNQCGELGTLRNKLSPQQSPHSCAPCRHPSRQ